MLSFGCHTQVSTVVQTVVVVPYGGCWLIDLTRQTSLFEIVNEIVRLGEH